MRDQEIPPTNAAIPEPDERAPLELDEDITQRDAWLFAPLIAAVVALPLIATVLLGVGTWHLIDAGKSASATQPQTFANRWPAREMPQIVVR